MSTVFHTQVAMDSYPQREWHFTVKLASGITEADIGKALSLDATPNTFKLAADGDHIKARLEQVEDRDVTGQLLGMAAFKFIEELPVKTGETVALGETVVGAGSGEVKAASTDDLADNYVVEVRSGYVVVLMR